MTSCLSKLKVTPNFCFPFKIPDNPTATNMYQKSTLSISSISSRIFERSWSKSFLVLLFQIISYKTVCFTKKNIPPITVSGINLPYSVYLKKFLYPTDRFAPLPPRIPPAGCQTRFITPRRRRPHHIARRAIIIWMTQCYERSSCRLHTTGPSEVYFPLVDQVSTSNGGHKQTGRKDLDTRSNPGCSEQGVRQHLHQSAGILVAGFELP